MVNRTTVGQGGEVLHYLLIVIVLILFSKLTVDAILLGALAIFLYQKYTKR